MSSDASTEHTAGNEGCPPLPVVLQFAVDPASFSDAELATLDAHQQVCPACRELFSEQLEIAARRQQRELGQQLSALSGAVVEPPIPPPPPIRKYLACLAAGFLLAVGLLWITAVEPANAQVRAIEHDRDEKVRAAESERDLKEQQLARLLADLGIEQAVDTREGALYPAGRDRIGVRLAIDARYVERVTFKPTPHAPAVTLYTAQQPRPGEKRIVVVTGTSDALVLDGRVVTAELDVKLYADLDESLVRLVPKKALHQTRDFLLSPAGIVTDPRPIDRAHDIQIRAIVADGDAKNVNRYLVTGRIVGFRDGMSAYLAVDATSTDFIWITSVVLPDANGDFAVRAFIGDGSRPAEALDKQIYRLFVVLAPNDKTLEVEDKLDKHKINWSKLGCVTGPARLKRNDGTDGFVDTPLPK